MKSTEEESAETPVRSPGPHLRQRTDSRLPEEKRSGFIFGQRVIGTSYQPVIGRNLPAAGHVLGEQQVDRLRAVHTPPEDGVQI